MVGLMSLLMAFELNQTRNSKGGCCSSVRFEKWFQCSQACVEQLFMKMWTLIIQDGSILKPTASLLYGTCTVCWLDVAGQVWFLLNQHGVACFHLFRKACPLFYLLFPPKVQVMPCHAVQAPCCGFVLLANVTASASLQLGWKNLVGRNPLLFSTERSVSECKHNQLMHLCKWMVSACIP